MNSLQHLVEGEGEALRVGGRGNGGGCMRYSGVSREEGDGCMRYSRSIQEEGSGYIR